MQSWSTNMGDYEDLNVVIHWADRNWDDYMNLLRIIHDSDKRVDVIMQTMCKNIRDRGAEYPVREYAHYLRDYFEVAMNNVLREIPTNSVGWDLCNQFFRVPNHVYEALATVTWHGPKYLADIPQIEDTRNNFAPRGDGEV